MEDMHGSDALMGFTYSTGSGILVERRTKRVPMVWKVTSVRRSVDSPDSSVRLLASLST